MSGPKRLMGACDDAATLLMRVTALLSHKTLDSVDIPMILPITVQLNNLLAVITDDESGGDDISDELTNFRELVSNRSHGLVMMALMSVVAMGLKKLADEENWRQVGFGNDEETFDSKTSEMVDALLNSLGENIEKEEEDER